MKTLYISDMDGTLLNNDSLISPRSAEIISELSHSGSLITVATARTPATVAPLLADTYTRCPAVVITGAALWDRDRRELIDTHIFAPGAAADIVTRFREGGLDPFIYTVASTSHLDVFHGYEMTPGENDFYQARRNLELKKFHLGSAPSAAEIDSSILLFSIGDTDRVTALAADLQRRDDCSVSCYPDIFSSTRSLIEVFAPDVSKARAVKDLAERLEVDRTVVFGDNLNDLSMMAVADIAVAVDNAFPAVKEAADVVIGPNSADSVARYIQELENS